MKMIFGTCNWHSVCEIQKKKKWNKNNHNYRLKIMSRRRRQNNRGIEKVDSFQNEDWSLFYGISHVKCAWCVLVYCNDNEFFFIVANFWVFFNLVATTFIFIWSEHINYKCSDQNLARSERIMFYSGFQHRKKKNTFCNRNVDSVKSHRVEMCRIIWTRQHL